MAAVYKCTKMYTGPRDQIVTGYTPLTAEYYNPLVPGAPLQSVTVQIANEDLGDSDGYKTTIDTQLGLLGADTMNWAI